ncbi:benzoate 4-monooxygenase cytochrome p450 [Lentinula edodes]|uniref:Benzoate 4-monooxygenase cytochrome p450 n=1 Tax=Lentinula edodes TaxID=5353 RepID=A0A1Q3E9I2_LENED|nr:benzoate 4-monooxygenase cytochrome p450 [Lentinula edodes]
MYGSEKPKELLATFRNMTHRFYHHVACQLIKNLDSSAYDVLNRIESTQRFSSSSSDLSFSLRWATGYFTIWLSLGRAQLGLAFKYERTLRRSLSFLKKVSTDNIAMQDAPQHCHMSSWTETCNKLSFLSFPGLYISPRFPRLCSHFPALFQPTIVFIISILVAFGIQFIGKSLRHPLNRFPGPQLARHTTWYRAYYELIKKGGWLRQLEVLHAIYGPIVRVGPNELHFNDPRAYGEIHAPGSRFHKDAALYSIFGNKSGSVFTTLDPQVAVVVKNVLSPYFSRRAIVPRVAIIQEKVIDFISRLKAHTSGSGKAINLDHAVHSVALDVLTSLIFSKPFHVLSAPEFDHPFIRHIEPTYTNIWIKKYLPDMNTPFLVAFTRFTSKFNAVANVFAAQLELVKEDLDIALQDVGVLRDGNSSSVTDDTEEFENDLTQTAATDGPLYPFFLRKVHEQMPITWTQSTDCEYELDEAWPQDNDIAYEDLEKLPYLTAVIKESLRLSHGVVTPLGRVVGPEDAMIMDESIPTGTIVGISSVWLKESPSRTVDSMKKESSSAVTEINADKYLVSFSRGPRSCIGIHLAWCELYIVFGFLFRKLEFVPVTELDPNQPLQFNDFFIPTYPGDPLLVFLNKYLICCLPLFYTTAKPKSHSQF